VPEEQQVAPAQPIPPHWPYKAEQLPVLGGLEEVGGLVVVVGGVVVGGAGAEPAGDTVTVEVPLLKYPSVATIW